MPGTKLMRCPHCRNVGECVWVGFGKDWVLCEHCQRRVRWSEVMSKYLVSSEEEWKSSREKVPAYH
ncbi:MAG: hypothetical protein PVI01_19680 [Gemmatimonadales bacterium]|jgi:hypothetical protein